MKKKIKLILNSKINFFKKNSKMLKLTANKFFWAESSLNFNAAHLHSVKKTLQLAKKICLISGSYKSINRGLKCNRHVLNRLLIDNNLFFFKNNYQFYINIFL